MISNLPDLKTGPRALALSLACAAASVGAYPAQAQQGSISQPVVQALPSRESLELNAALSRLARNPRDISALIDAGNAASAMGDSDAAIGFFRRAAQIEENHPRVKAGLAGALVMAGDPYSAIPMFDEAVRAGADPLSIAGDRGLAYDLVGQPDTAQQYYRQALGNGENATISRRLALSLSISGRDREVEETLLPLLRDQDKAAWRARAFSLAILGKTKDAVKITQTLLPPTLAKGIVPYLEYMPRLTNAQKAAAANLGRFPRASEIGRDDPRVGFFKPQTAVPAQVASAGQALVPQGKPLGKQAKSALSAEQEKRRAQAAEKARREAEKRASRVKPPEVRPERTPGSPNEPVLAAAESKPAESPAAIMAAATPPKPKSAPPAPPKPAVAEPEAPAPKPSDIFQRAAEIAAKPDAPTTPAPSTPAPAPASAATAPVPARGQAEPGFDLASLSNGRAAPAPSSPTPAPAPASAPAPAKPAPPQAAPAAAPAPQFSAMFGDLGRPSVAAAPKAGAVDITKIEPPREEAAPEPKLAVEAPPSHPSRIWVQLGIGQDKSALSFDWRKFARQAPDAFKGVEGYVSKMNRTNRLLAGPFESRSRANSFLSDLREAGVEGPYLWTSPAGQVVDKL